MSNSKNQTLSYLWELKTAKVSLVFHMEGSREEDRQHHSVLCGVLTINVKMAHCLTNWHLCWHVSSMLWNRLLKLLDNRVAITAIGLL